ncbi:CRISPR system Cascade subunit CasE [Nocardiopsis mwathae]|uniref:CRISPR system Cascade subunit CasE n=2 Tax=Nocardiopsis mwathae TaxID=1472723 RepID=A0A7W9YFW7_9ACTN|nr:CRISPR system Cascade subunit CasE [Nocardiopsis mwathae]
MGGFPGILPSAGGSPRVLWRLDRNARAEVLLYVVSPDKPDLTHLVEDAGWPTLPEVGWETRDYMPFLDRLAVGDVWGFRLTANPVHSVRVEGKEDKEKHDTKPTPHVTPRHQMRWLLQREERSGFQVVRKAAEQERLPDGDDCELVVWGAQRLRFRKTGSAERAGGRGASDVRLTTVTFDGRLQVTDPAKLRHTLTAGLGRAKAYGCGLMTLAPVASAGATQRRSA